MIKPQWKPRKRAKDSRFSGFKCAWRDHALRFLQDVGNVTSSNTQANTNQFLGTQPNNDISYASGWNTSVHWMIHFHLSPKAYIGKPTGDKKNGTKNLLNVGAWIWPIGFSVSKKMIDCSRPYVHRHFRLVSDTPTS